MTLRNIAAAAASNLLSAIVDVNALKLLATWTAKAASFKVSAAVGRQSAVLRRVSHGRQGRRRPSALLAMSKRAQSPNLLGQP